MVFRSHYATQLTPSTASHERSDPSEWLAQVYAYPDQTAVQLRVNFISTIDGAATVDGRSGGLGGDGDRLLFGVLRALADAIIVGARTAVVENYGPPDVGTLYLVSRSLSIPDDFATLRSSNVVVVTCSSADSARRTALIDAGASVIDCGDDDVDLPALIAHCSAAGQHHLLCEGGPTLFAALLAAGLVDELCLTTAPLLAAGQGPRIAHSPRPIDPTGFTLTQLLSDDDGYWYARWTRA